MSLRVLYVDDEPDIREVACLSLSLDPELEVQECASGVRAVEVARSWQPHLIMLDVMMPGMDGPETFARLRAQADTAAIPIVFITARTQEKDVARLHDLGAAGVIQKPFNPMTLATDVRTFLPS